MNKNVVAILITVVAVAAIAAVVLINRPDDAANNAAMTSTSMNPAAAQNETHSSSSPLGTQPDQSTDDVQSGEVAMDIKGFAFSQKTLKIKKGTTVTWTNQDDSRHDIAPVDESSAFEGSKLLSQGESYSFTFNTPGTYNYICSPHPYMKAMVEVVE